MFNACMKTVGTSVLAVLLSLGSAFADDSSKCLNIFSSMKKTYNSSNFEATIIDSSQPAIQLYSLAHFSKNNGSYSTWKALNNEVSGYALRQDLGFDYNQNRSYVGPLTWHQTLIWDRLLSSNRDLSGYDCSIIGRTRLAGRKVSVIRMTPVDDVRYSFLFSKDDETSLPVEIGVLSPSQIFVAKFTISALHSASPENLVFPDETFDRIIGSESQKTDKKDEVWPELTIPNPFVMTSSGVQSQEDGSSLEYQVFSDGMVDFRVYKNSLSSLNIQSATDGTITVLRKNSKNYEYAVVGEIPLELSAIVLSKISQ
ncbi:MAG: MucB/RseB C-terminal domain-containing protein [Succinivibrio sp.]